MRYLASIALALIVSLGLFWGMDKLVNKERHELVSNDDLRMVEFIRIKPDEKYRRKSANFRNHHHRNVHRHHLK